MLKDGQVASLRISANSGKLRLRLGLIKSTGEGEQLARVIPLEDTLTDTTVESIEQAFSGMTGALIEHIRTELANAPAGDAPDGGPVHQG